MNHSDIKLVIDRLHAVEFSPHEADDLAIVHAIDMLEKLGNQVAEQAAVIEKLRDAHKKVVRSSNMEDKLEIAMISHTALAIPTDSTQILQEWLTSQINLNGYSYSINDTYVLFSVDEPPDDAYDEGSLVPLYAIKKPEILK